jgi:outer membrane protein assembly factor BamB
MSRLGLSLLVACFVLVSVSHSQEKASTDWPSFRGPNRDNLSPDTKLLKAWPAAGPKLLWTAKDVGIGYSSVTVVGGKVFTMGGKGDDAYLFAVDRTTGKNLWATKTGAVGMGGGYKGTRCTPTVDGDLVYGVSGVGDLLCVQAKDGKVVWQKNYRKDFGGSSGIWDFSESPLIDGDALICTPGGAKATMVALDKKTGKELWRCAANSAAGYSSIVIWEAGNIKQYVTLTANGPIGVSAKDGKLLWKSDRWRGNTANIPTPIVLEKRLFLCAGYGGGGGMLVEVTGTGEEVTLKEIYYQDKLKNKHGGFLAIGDLLFGDRDDSGNPQCADLATGEVKWERKRGRSKGAGSVSMTYADSHLYLRYSDGWMALVPATGDEYKEKGSFKIPGSNSNSWAHPVVIGGRMYLREKETILCYDVRGK